MELDLLEFESTLRCLADLDSNLLIEPDFVNLGNCIAVSTERLKYGLAIEIKGNELKKNNTFRDAFIAIYSQLVLTKLAKQ